MKLLTPAPRYPGEYGRHSDGSLWQAAALADNRLAWRRIPLWHILTHLDAAARDHLHTPATPVTTLKGITAPWNRSSRNA